MNTSKPIAPNFASQRISSDSFYVEKLKEEAKRAFENWENFEEDIKIDCLGHGDTYSGYVISCIKPTNQNFEDILTEFQEKINDQSLSESYSVKCPKCVKLARFYKNDEYIKETCYMIYRFVCLNCKILIQEHDGWACI